MVPRMVQEKERQKDLAFPWEGLVKCPPVPVEETGEGRPRIEVVRYFKLLFGH